MAAQQAPYSPPFGSTAKTHSTAGWQMATVLAIAIPWLSPITWGPAPEMVQSLLSAIGGAVVLVGWNAYGPRWGTQVLARTLALGWLLAALLSAVAGLLQYFGLATDLVNAGLLNPAAPGEAYANLRQRNQFASLMALGLVALLYLDAENRQANPSRPQRLAMGVLLLLLTAANVTSGSRTGLLQWVCIAALATVWSRRGSRSTMAWAWFATMLYVFATLLLPQALESVTGAHVANAIERLQENDGCEDRAILWRNMLELIAKRPWLGWGWNDLKFTHFMFPYHGARFCVLLDNAHNLPLHLAVELGVPAALLLCGGALVITIKAAPWRDTDPARHMAWGGLAIITIHSLLEYPLWYAPFQVATLMAVVFLWRSRTPRPTSGPSTAGMGANFAAATLLLAMVAYTGWDYWRIGQLFVPEAKRAAAYRDNTLSKVQDSWLFQDTVRFARVTTTPVTPANARQMYADALQTMHLSPEPLVIIPLLESARLLGIDTPQIRRVRQQWLALYGGMP